MQLDPRSLTIAVLMLALSACRPDVADDPPPAPEVVKVPVTKYVPVPEKLTKPCPVTRAKTRTVEAVVSAYNANVTSLETCNAQIDGVRNLGDP